MLEFTKIHVNIRYTKFLPILQPYSVQYLQASSCIRGERTLQKTMASVAHTRRAHPTEGNLLVDTPLPVRQCSRRKANLTIKEFVASCTE